MHLHRITIAVNNMDAMIAFYNAVFDCNIQPVPNTPFFAGELAGLVLFLCPNTITQIEAEKNRQQLHLRVSDMDGVLNRVQTARGALLGDMAEQGGVRAIGIVDPDGNSLELSEQITP